MTPLLNITATMVASIIILEIDNGNFHDDGSHYLEEKLANSTTGFCRIFCGMIKFR